MFLGLPDPDPDPFVRGIVRGTDLDPAPVPSLFSCVVRTEIMPVKQNFNTKFKQKINFFRLKTMCLLASYKKKYEEHFFFSSLKSMKKGVGSGVRSGSRSSYGSGDPHQNVTDPSTDNQSIVQYCTHSTVTSLGTSN